MSRKAHSSYEHHPGEEQPEDGGEQLPLEETDRHRNDVNEHECDEQRAARGGKEARCEREGNRKHADDHYHRDDGIY